MEDIYQQDSAAEYDKGKYKEMILDAAEILLRYFSFDSSAYSNNKKVRRKKWYEELRDIEAEMI